MVRSRMSNWRAATLWWTMDVASTKAELVVVPDGFAKETSLRAVSALNLALQRTGPDEGNLVDDSAEPRRP